MSTVENRLTDAFAARAELETVDADVLRHRREDVEAAARQDETAVDALGITEVGPGALDASERSSLRPRWTAVLATAVAAVLVLFGAVAGVDRLTQRGAAGPASSPQDLFEALGRPQEPGELALGNGLGSSVVASSVRVVARTSTTTYWLGVTTDHQVCFSVDEAHSSEGTCTLAGLWHRRFSAGDALDVKLADGTEAWLTPNGYGTAALRQRGFTSLAPNLWVRPALSNG